jgi:hypothetical protein
MSFNSSLSYKTYNLDKVLILSAAILLIISALQDFLDPVRRTNPTVIIQALTRLILGLFMIYFFATVLKQS